MRSVLREHASVADKADAAAIGSGGRGSADSVDDYLGADRPFMACRRRYLCYRPLDTTHVCKLRKYVNQLRHLTPLLVAKAGITRGEHNLLREAVGVKSPYTFERIDLCMRQFFFCLFFFLGLFWVIDLIAFEGQNSADAWQDALRLGKKYSSNIYNEDGPSWR